MCDALTFPPCLYELSEIESALGALDLELVAARTQRTLVSLAARSSPHHEVVVVLSFLLCYQNDAAVAFTGAPHAWRSSTCTRSPSMADWRVKNASTAQRRLSVSSSLWPLAASD